METNVLKSRRNSPSQGAYLKLCVYTEGAPDCSFTNVLIFLERTYQTYVKFYYIFSPRISLLTKNASKAFKKIAYSTRPHRRKGMMWVANKNIQSIRRAEVNPYGSVLVEFNFSLELLKDKGLPALNQACNCHWGRGLTSPDYISEETPPKAKRKLIFPPQYSPTHHHTTPTTLNAPWTPTDSCWYTRQLATVNKTAEHTTCECRFLVILYPPYTMHRSLIHKLMTHRSTIEVKHSMFKLQYHWQTY